MPLPALRLRPPRLDRIVRGRAWIPVLGALLVAIVGLRVEVLKLGSSVGSEVQQATTLESSNSALRAQISALSDSQRIATLAQAYGMHMPNPLDVHFVQTSVGTHVQAAIRNITPPSTSAFLTGLASEQQASQQSAQAVAALNGAGTASPATGSTVGAGTATGTGTATGPAATTSTGGSPSSATIGATSGQVTAGAGPTTAGTGATTSPSTGATTSTGTGATTSTGPISSAGGASSAATTPAASSTAAGGTAGATTGVVSPSSPPSTSQTTLPAGSTNGGTGLAG